MNMSSTSIESDIAGCTDGTLRKLTVNKHRNSLSVSGIVRCQTEDPIIRIAATPSFSVGLSKASILSIWSHKSIFGNGLNHRHSVHLSHIVCVWASGTRFFALHASADVHEFLFDGNRLTATRQCRTFQRFPLTSAVWAF
jgi:hypothetical protein